MDIWSITFSFDRLPRTMKLTKRMEKKLDGNYTRMLRAILNKSWGQYPHKASAVRPLTTHHENYQSIDEADTRDTAGEVRTN